ncbi:vacuolar fusion protein MON1 homolog A isoform X2 [Onychostoma macrolepis]|uniref:vacuolar fusion protein MON1 homolog A isoform X2 n=1 Tax=Onychostoma macrolepis TaxID=369639 RepID=UPI00272DA285|nr:vacuolar fusion protein MON1 homolog A isoform X2 [Onychostoma macrolepis]
MHRSDNRGSWEFQPEDTLIEKTGKFPSSLAQANLNGQKKAGSAVDVPSLAYRNEDIMSESWRQHRKHVFVLSEAGKPIYSRYGNEEALASTMGVMMALVSFVQAGGNMIRSIFSDEHTVVFLQKGPLVFVSVSATRQSEQQLRSELLHVYHQIVSMLTQASINRIFERRKNFDLRRLLFGSEKVLDGLLDVMDSDPSFMLSAVQCLPLPSSSRDTLSHILQKAVTPNLVFSFLIANNRLVSVVQEKTVLEDARLKPSDLHLLFNLIRASSAFQAGEIWTPICLPLFNHDCYFYAYVAYLDPPECTVCLVLLSTDKEAFYALAECKRKIEEAFASQNALQWVTNTPLYYVGDIGVANLKHFLYKPSKVLDHHRQLPQFTWSLASLRCSPALLRSSLRNQLSVNSLNCCDGSKRKRSVSLSVSSQNTPVPRSPAGAPQTGGDQTDRIHQTLDFCLSCSLG